MVVAWASALVVHPVQAPSDASRQRQLTGVAVLHSRVGARWSRVCAAFPEDSGIESRSEVQMGENCFAGVAIPIAYVNSWQVFEISGAALPCDAEVRQSEIFRSDQSGRSASCSLPSL